MSQSSISDGLKDSTEEQILLRSAALWAVDFVEQALPIFEDRNPGNTRPREAIQAGREYAEGKKRDKNLRVVALASFKVGKEVDEPSKHVTQAATAIAAIAYTHTDLQTGVQGVRQARHILGPVVHSALALEMAAGGKSEIGNEVVSCAIKSAPLDVRYILKHMPPQPRGSNRLSILFFDLDSGLRSE